ncbi:MAG: hypothetical protein MRZ79_20605 [Bacteroidia bacterium]|nr:hypothetical protein [Bacteroidia bacterium]
MALPRNSNLLPFLLFSGCFCTLSLWLASYIHPAEDAVILFRYAKHLSQEGVIAFNQGGPPTEGATDFLWMVLIAGGNTLGLSPYSASLLLSALGLILMSYLIWENAPKSGYPKLLAISCLMLAPQWWAAIQGFSPYFLGGFLIAAVFSFYKRESIGFAIFGFLTCLTRPDALIVIAPLGLYFLFASTNQKKDFVRFFWGAILPGILYFTWRYKYFGELFPLPFYVKGFQTKFLGIFDLNSLKYVGIYLLRYVGVLLLALSIFFYKFPNRLKALILICTIFPIQFYSSIALEQNVAHRLIMPLFLGLFSCFLLSWPYIPKAQIYLFLFLATNVFYSFSYFSRSLPLAHDNYIALGKEMASIPGRLATTEAGRIPYYSEWETMDMWGLNSPELSRRLIKENDLGSFQADVILLDDGELEFDQLFGELDGPYRAEKSWDNMVFNALKYGVESGDYELYWVNYQNKRDESQIERFCYSIFPNSYEARRDLWLLKKDYPYKEALTGLEYLSEL